MSMKSSHRPLLSFLFLLLFSSFFSFCFFLFYFFFLSLSIFLFLEKMVLRENSFSFVSETNGRRISCDLLFLKKRKEKVQVWTREREREKLSPSRKKERVREKVMKKGEREGNYYQNSRIVNFSFSFSYFFFLFFYSWKEMRRKKKKEMVSLSRLIIISNLPSWDLLSIFSLSLSSLYLQEEGKKENLTPSLLIIIIIFSHLIACQVEKYIFIYQIWQDSSSSVFFFLPLLSFFLFLSEDEGERKLEKKDVIFNQT